MVVLVVMVPCTTNKEKPATVMIFKSRRRWEVKVFRASWSTADEVRSQAHSKDLGPYSTLLGSQAHSMPWPSNELWNLGFKTLTGLGTVDKYMREASLFNPLLGIEDFRSMEHDLGPKKRKALEGICFQPKPLKNTEGSSENKEIEILKVDPPTLHPNTILEETKDLPTLIHDCTFSPGSSDNSTPRRKRGRPSSKESAKLDLKAEIQCNLPKRRGRPPKSAAIQGPKIKSFKSKEANALRKRHTSIKSCWEKNVFDLKIDLNNHFVVVDCSSIPSSSCVIEEVKESNGEEEINSNQAIAWNCRGLGNAATVRQLKELIRRSNPELLVLSEVRLTEAKLKSILVRIHFQSFYYVPPIGTAGGLALCWMNGVGCNIESADKYKITACISSDPPDKPWMFMGIYGPPVYAEKERFWKELGDYVCNCKLPLVLMGDLNGTMEDSECLNYSRRSNIARYSFDLRRSVHRSGLIDLGFLGVKFTWFKKGSSSTGGTCLKRARLDRALASVEWRLAWPNAIVNHLTSSSSDHNPILLDTNGGRHCSKPQFKYELMWERDPRVFWVVKKAWIESTHVNPMVNIYRKLKTTKDHLRKWNKSHFRKLSSQIAEARCTLKEIESNRSVDEIAHTEARAALNEALAREEIFWRQKSRVAWLKEGDRATKFFMASTVTRRRRNYIEYLKDDQGEIHEEPKDIATIFIQKFNKTFSKASNRTSLVNFDWQFTGSHVHLEEDLYLLPNEEEVLSALMAMGSDKAPGPDGLPAAFFKSHWDTIKSDMMAMIHHFFTTAKLPEFINDTNLVLIPKKANPVTANDFRPIALCNVVYKCISKIVALRLRPILPKIISPVQTAFIKGRSISENIAMAHEIVHSMAKKKGSRGFMMIKLDMEKAYDKMDWDFVEEALAFHGVKSPLREWIKSCIQIKRLNLMVNGVNQGRFAPSCGLRQGDPLSPALFILAADLLSRVIIEFNLLGKIRGFKTSRSATPITHLMFADDVMLFGQASLKEADAFLQCLQIYCSWSGQSVNFQKSTIHFSKGVPRSRADAIAGKLGMKKMKEDALYLGLPLLKTRKRAANLKFLIDKVRHRIEGWKARLLSKAGRACLVQSVGNSLAVYTASAEVIPSHIAGSIDRSLRSFWWGDSEKKKSIHTIDWGNLCKSKLHGGLGFRQTKDINKAFLMSWGWKMVTETTSLWARTMERKYLRGNSFWDAQSKGSDSRLWKAILKTRPFLKEGICRRIGDGRSTSIWFDPWVPTGNSQPEPIRDATQGANLVEYFLNENHSWNERRVRQWFHHDDARHILNIGLPNAHQGDSWRWLGVQRCIDLEGTSAQFRSLSTQLRRWKLKHINRKENFMAHNVAKWAKLNAAVGDIDVKIMDPLVFNDYKEWHPDAG
uniref:Reverse transcriptase domain-containing protein n=1 Tax=Cannabis sativa TaxID=3483 RepID=A0A803NT74_CANSA